MTSVDSDFAEAENLWDLEVLYADLASVKGKHLTPVEKQHLRGLLCGYSPADIAKKLHKSVKGVEVELCNTLYQYVKNLVGQSNGKVENWRNITEWLDVAGYKSEQAIKDYVSLNILVKKCEIDVKKCNVNIKNNHLLIDLNIRLVTPLSSDSISSENQEEVD